jgi:hypothetical protein
MQLPALTSPVLAELSQLIEKLRYGRSEFLGTFIPGEGEAFGNRFLTTSKDGCRMPRPCRFMVGRPVGCPFKRDLLSSELERFLRGASLAPPQHQASGSNGDRWSSEHDHLGSKRDRSSSEHGHLSSEHDRSSSDLDTLSSEVKFSSSRLHLLSSEGQRWDFE